MATQVISQTDATPTIPLVTGELAERPATRADSPIEQEKPVVQEKQDEQQKPVEQDKPKVRRIIDEEGGTTTASVSHQRVQQIE